MGKRGFLYGTLILVGAGFITKVLGFIYRIALSRIIGDEGIGLFHMAFPILIFTVVITTAGLPVAISKLVSEAEAKNEEHRIRSILIVAIMVVIFTSIFFTSLLLLCAPVIANTLLTDERTVYSLMGIAPIIPVIAISSVFRGYFQGRQNMSPYAISTIIEQTVRIFTVLSLATYLLPYGIEFASAGAMIGMVIGELAGMSFLLFRFKKDPKRPILFKSTQSSTQQRKPFFKQWSSAIQDLVRIALPVTASRMVGSLSYAVEPIVVAQSLAIAGITTATSTAMYGQLEGMAIPLIFFPAFITYALAVSLVPAISEAAAQNNMRMVEHRLQQAIRLAMIIGAPCAVLLFILAEPVSVLIYREPDVARLMKIIAPFAVFLYLQGPLTSVLQGLDQAKTAMRNSIFGAFIKTGLIFALASQPSLGIDGVAIAINCGIIIVTALHFISILKTVPFTIQLMDWIKLLLAVAIVGIVAYQMYIRQGDSLLIHVILTILVCMGTYGLCLLLLDLIHKDDVNRIPYVGKWIAKLLPPSK
ncbi:stage V sporulation protein B [Hazenella coriacea]|uniref:Stage V sporulation protein B n=1 Tax=Hazenella coriacea TaxID=1179467 RepID=A0A4R3LB08_9BACL|nr:stage V sporulation protein B [Hazenella coriacea]TCS96458.1 stage V sporulation protein B [Hazenella coriacea]